MLNSIPDGVATTDATGRLTYTNLPMSVILGLKDVVAAATARAKSEDAPLMTDHLVASLASV